MASVRLNPFWQQRHEQSTIGSLADRTQVALPNSTVGCHFSKYLMRGIWYQWINQVTSIVYEACSGRLI